MPREQRNKYLLYASGCLIFSSGAYLFIYSDLGADPLDVFALGVMEHLPVSVGISQAAVAVICLAAVAGWTRQRPHLSPLLTFFLCGSFIDLLRWADPVREVQIGSIGLLALAVLLCAYGSAFIIMSGFGIRAIDLLAITMSTRRRWPFWVAKGLIEASLMTTGFLLGGPLGIGTVCFLLGVDLLIQPLIKVNSEVFRIPNSGLPERAPQSID